MIASDSTLLAWDLEQIIARNHTALSTHMDEGARRLWAATEMLPLGYGRAAIFW
jgi:hypothetical protein